MSEVLSLEEQCNHTLDILGAYRPTWLDYLERFERSAGLDASLRDEWNVINGHMDCLLEDYFELMSGVTLKTEHA